MTLIDDIDRCKLLINQEPHRLKDPFEEKYYHSAVWHSDLIELNRMGLVTGITEMSEYEFELYRFDELKKLIGKHVQEDEEGNLILYTKDANGNYQEFKHKKPIYDEDDTWKTCVGLKGPLGLTDKGISELSKLMQRIELSTELQNLTQPLLEIKRYDTAIREASLFMETSIKNFYKNDLYGQKLIDFHIKDLVKHNNGFNSAAIKCYRGELRTIFKFIRNDFAHNFKVISEEQCRAILHRIGQTFHEFKEVRRVYYQQGKS